MIENASAGARWTLAGAVLGSVLVLVAAVLWWWPSADPAPPPVALPGPWEPPSNAAPQFSYSAPAGLTTGSAPTTRPATARSVTKRPPATRRPATRTPSPRPSPRPSIGPNLSLRGDGDADGSSKAEGTRFNDVRDDDLGSFWSPVGVTGEISVKWPVPVRLSRIDIREAPGGGRIRNWQLRNHDNDAVLASGTGAGVITFAPVTLRKITFVILSAGGTPRVSEYRTFAG
jgi:hypothetical protein